MTETPAPATEPLQGCGVLVTRPVHQASGLARRINQLGGRAVLFPVLEITAPDDLSQLEVCTQQLDAFDIAIFVSANAVEHALPPIFERRDWPAGLQIAVIGRRSAEALGTFGLQADLCPQTHFNSEALLELEEMHQVSGKRIVIFRGNSGREFLADSLRERGAQVEYVETYRRFRPDADCTALVETWRSGNIDLVQVNSVESLENLFAMLDEEGQTLLRKTPLLVVSERMFPVADRLGFAQAPVLASNATDDAVLDALIKWRHIRYNPVHR